MEYGGAVETAVGEIGEGGWRVCHRVAVGSRTDLQPRGQAQELLPVPAGVRGDTTQHSLAE